MISTEEIRLRLTLQYDGTRYHGWQIQPDHGTVQGELERVVERLTGSRRPVIGSGRTDRGVHALGQVASVDLPDHWTPERFHKACNALLPADIWLSASRHAAPDFHPRYGAVSRAYLYRIGVDDASHSPFRAPFCWPLGEAPDEQLLQTAASMLPGSHLFGAFAKSGQPERGERCDILSAMWSRDGGEFHFRIKADRFLHRMVRYLVGTMVDIGRGRRPISDMESLLAGAPDLVTSPPAPASGLYLTHVVYPDDAPRTVRPRGAETSSPPTETTSPHEDLP